MNQGGGSNVHQRTATTTTSPESVIRERPLHRNRPPFRRLVNDYFVAIIIGSALIFAGAALIFWNENHAVMTARSLDEGYNAVVRIPSSASMSRENDGKLVHLWGVISVEDPLMDDYFGISVKVVKLKRRTQIYQWVEEESVFADEATVEGSDTSYMYSQEWKDKLIESGSFYIPFGHENPTSIPIGPSTQTSTDVSIGAYRFSPAVKELFDHFVPISGDEPPLSDEIKLHNGMYYLTKDIFNLEIGDMRVQFYFSGNEGQLITLIAKQTQSGLHPYITSSGRELLIMRQGKLSPEEMFSAEQAQNRILTWFYRLAGWFLIFIGMTSISTIIKYFVILSPLLREVIFLGTGSANLTLSMSLSLCLIGTGWCFYRPGLAFAVFLVAIFPLMKVAVRRQRNKHRG